MKNQFIFIVFLFFISCKEAVLFPKNYELNKDTVFYSGIYEVTKFNFSNPKFIDINELHNYPKLKHYSKDYLLDKWQKGDIESNVYYNMLNELNSLSYNNTSIKDITNKLKSKDTEIFISGLYKRFKSNEKDFFKHYYYFYLIDFSKREMFKFERLDF